MAFSPWTSMSLFISVTTALCECHPIRFIYHPHLYSVALLYPIHFSTVLGKWEFPDWTLHSFHDISLECRQAGKQRCHTPMRLSSDVKADHLAAVKIASHLKALATCHAFCSLLFHSIAENLENFTRSRLVIEVENVFCMFFGVFLGFLISWRRSGLGIGCVRRETGRSRGTDTGELPSHSGRVKTSKRCDDVIK